MCICSLAFIKYRFPFMQEICAFLSSQLHLNGACQIPKANTSCLLRLYQNLMWKPNLNSVFFLGGINAHSSESNLEEIMLKLSFPVMIKTQQYMVFLFKEYANVFCHPTHGRTVSVTRGNALCEGRKLQPYCICPTAYILLQHALLLLKVKFCLYNYFW